jgi:hypothetical protein
MAKNKSSVSGKSTYREIGEYWDSHDLSEIADQIDDIAVEFDPGSDIHYFAVENSLSSELQSLAKERGISAEALVDRWLRERVGQEAERR